MAPVELEGGPFDVIVVGGGINGTGIARDAARRGLKVLLLDKTDIAAGTTSWSSR
ncbi:MAG: FAD-dependent oxidoreductase, partial [Chloroflexia bacterium]|nr:FAD-dependent oxidoreductase [Chloroflexia bacterium]